MLITFIFCSDENCHFFVFSSLSAAKLLQIFKNNKNSSKFQKKYLQDSDFLCTFAADLFKNDFVFKNY